MDTNWITSLPFWALLGILVPVVFAQNMAFTWVSRSRNGGDVKYHRYASWCSNGVWFVTQVLFLSSLLPNLMAGVWWKVIIVGIVYAFATTEGSCYMMARLLKTETGKRKVGARADEPAPAVTEAQDDVYDPLSAIRGAVPVASTNEPLTQDILALMFKDAETLTDKSPMYLALNIDGVTDLGEGSSNFTNFFDPVTKIETIRSGALGRLFGLEVLTDIHVDKDKRFLEHRAALYL